MKRWRGAWSHEIKRAEVQYFNRRNGYGTIKFDVYTDVDRDAVKEAIHQMADECYGAQVTEMWIKEDDAYATTEHTVRVTATVYAPNGLLVAR